MARTEAHGFKHDDAICISFWVLKHKRQYKRQPIYIDKQWWMAEQKTMPNSVTITTSWDDFVSSGVAMFSVTTAIMLGLLPPPVLDVDAPPDPACNVVMRLIPAPYIAATAAAGKIFLDEKGRRTMAVKTVDWYDGFPMSRRHNALAARTVINQ
jgi:hypothetical protein